MIIDDLIYCISSKFTKKELVKVCQSPKKYLSLFRECDLNQTEINIHVIQYTVWAYIYMIEPGAVKHGWLVIKSHIPCFPFSGTRFLCGKQAVKIEAKSTWCGSWVVSLKTKMEQKLGQLEQHSKSSLRWNCHRFSCFCHHCWKCHVL